MDAFCHDYTRISNNPPSDKIEHELRKRHYGGGNLLALYVVRRYPLSRAHEPSLWYVVRCVHLYIEGSILNSITEAVTDITEAQLPT